MDRVQLLVSAQRALVGAVGPQVRGVCVDGGGTGITATFHVDGTLTQDEREAIEGVGSEIAADFPEVDSVEVKVLYVDDAAHVPDCSGTWVYLQRARSAG